MTIELKLSEVLPLIADFVENKLLDGNRDGAQFTTDDIRYDAERQVFVVPCTDIEH